MTSVHKGLFHRHCQDVQFYKCKLGIQDTCLPKILLQLDIILDNEQACFHVGTLYVVKKVSF